MSTFKWKAGIDAALWVGISPISEDKEYLEKWNPHIPQAHSSPDRSLATTAVTVPHQSFCPRPVPVSAWDMRPCPDKQL